MLKVMSRLELSLFFYVIPTVSVGFLLLIFIYKLYYEVRSRYGIVVNCWFCNENAVVPFKNKNSWFCTNSVCQQYNGFNNDGDYNTEIVKQFGINKNIYSHLEPMKETLYSNGFCFDCNKRQHLKMEKISQFEAENENTFEMELCDYKFHLEKLYGLCPTCEKHLKEVLQDKKKIILGLKLSDLVLKPNAIVKSFPKAIAGRLCYQKWKIATTFLILLLAIINFYLALENTFGSAMQYVGQDVQNITEPLILGICKTILDVLRKNTADILNVPVLRKSFLLIKSILFFVVKYFGIKSPKFGINIEQVIHFSSLFLSLFQSLLDGFHLTRYTALLAIWSMFTIAENVQYFDSIGFLKVITSIIVLIFSTPSLDKCSNIDTSNSFHKIYPTNNYKDGDSSFKYTLFNNDHFCNSKNTSTIFNEKFYTKSPNMKDPLASAFEENKYDMNAFVYPSKTAQIRKGSLFSSAFLPMSRTTARSNRGQYGESSEICEQKDTNNSKFQGNATNCISLNYYSDQLNYTFPNFNQLCSGDICNSNQINYNTRPDEERCYQCRLSNITAAKKIKPPILSPSKFGYKSKNFETSTQSWVSGGYFNSNHYGNINVFDRNLVLPTVTEKNLSRASSQSSGFESNSSSIRNLSLKNCRLKYCGIGNDADYCSLLQNKSSGQEASMYNSNSFHKEIPNSITYKLGLQPSSYSSNNFFKYNHESFTNNWNLKDFDWRQLKKYRTRETDFFNLTKMNEELTPVRRQHFYKTEGY